VLPGRSRCIVTPTRQDLPILWRSALYYLSASDAVADAKRRIDRILKCEEQVLPSRPLRGGTPDIEGLGVRLPDTALERSGPFTLTLYT